MPESALIVSQSGRVTHGLPALVSARGHDPIETLVTDRSEDGRYYLAPGTVERVERRAAGAERPPVLVVDGTVHPGQTVDLRARLPSVTVRDRRELLWERLAERNPVAATRLELRRARVERREAAGEQRDGATRSPTGTNGRLAARDTQIQEQRDTLDRRRDGARERVQRGYTGVDGRVVLLGRIGAPTTDVWAALTGEPATAAAGCPARPRTATVELAPHTLAVTDTPGVLGTGGLPDPLTEAVPGLTAALEQASCVLGVGGHREGLRAAVCERFDAAWRSLDTATSGAARDALRDQLDTAEYAVRLPYGDDAHALVSDLHEGATVHATEYRDAVCLRVEVAGSATAQLRRRVSAIDGEMRSLDAGE
jgi:hypothetical protein